MTHLVSMQEYDRNKIEETDEKGVDDKANNCETVSRQPNLRSSLQIRHNY
jgi:hypothetical protein